MENPTEYQSFKIFYSSGVKTTTLDFFFKKEIYLKITKVVIRQSILTMKQRIDASYLQFSNDNVS